MHSFEQGFLSEPFDDIRNQVRRQYSDWRNLLLKVNSQCVEAQHSITIYPHDTRAILAAVLFARTLASTQAAVILIEHGLLSQARTILRASIETLFALGAIYRKPELTDELVQSHEADKRTVADRMLRWKSPELRAAVEKQITESELRAFLTSKARSINHFELARAAEMEEWYLTIYSLLSFPAHGAVSDLANHVVSGDEGLIESLKNEPELTGQASTWGYAIEIQLKAVQALAGIFANVRIDIEADRNALRVLSQKSEG